MSKGNFKRSNQNGTIGEQYATALLGERGLLVTKDAKARLSHDLIINLGHDCCTMEVKYDMMARLTGNIAIEYRNSKKGTDSGIFGTSSDFWAILISIPGGHELWLAPTKKLLEFVLETEPHKMIEAGGDDNADLFLYKKNDILPKVFVLANAMGSEDIRKFFNDNFNLPTPTTDDSPE